jgi:hypothetical protein
VTGSNSLGKRYPEIAFKGWQCPGSKSKGSGLVIDLSSNKSMLRLVVPLAMMDSLLVASFLLDYWAGHPWPPMTRLINLNIEANLPAWYSSAKLLATGLGFGLIAWLTRLNAPSSPACYRALILLSGSFLLLSMDECVQIHEHIGAISDTLLPGGSREDTMVHYTGVWMFVAGIPAFAALLAVVWQIQGAVNARAFKRLLLGMVVFAASACGIEFLANFTQNHAQLVAQVALEEWGEMTGSTIMLWAMLTALSSYTPAVVRIDP